ncbi:MAG TPA: DNA topoisomerase IB, partial [Thiobacillaceae bacterium]
TWAGTVLASQTLKAIGASRTGTECKRNIVRAVESVAQKLGNTKTVCRKSYIHPAIFDAYVDGSMTRMLRARQPHLSDEECAVLALLQAKAARQQRKKAS